MYETIKMWNYFDIFWKKFLVTVYKNIEKASELNEKQLKSQIWNYPTDSV